jgi:hypothetical protein
MVRTASELSVMAFPYYFYTHFAKAKILQRDGHEKKAQQLLAHIIAMDPTVSRYHVAENILVQKLAERALEEQE